MPAAPTERPILTSKLSGFGTTIFAEMSALAVATGAINLGQGFPDTDGPSEVLISRTQTSPLFAAMVNAAASHVAEQDDVHNGSVFHPAAVVFPPALAVAQAIGASGRELIAASVVWVYATQIAADGLDRAATASVVSLSGGALFANIVSVVLLVVETVSFHRR